MIPCLPDAPFAARPLALPALFLLCLCAGACQQYDSPPEVRLERPEGGAFLSGAPLVLHFSEPVRPESLAVKVWPTARGTLRVAREAVEPLLPSCPAKAEPACAEGVSLAVAEDGRTATLELGSELGNPGVAMVLEVEEGLSDAQGNAARVSRYFDFQFRSSDGAGGEEVAFDSGIYMVGATIQKPLPAVLKLTSNIVVGRDGRFAMAGAATRPLGDAPKTTLNPEEVYVDGERSGWSIYVTGTVRATPDGRRLLESDPFDVNLPVAGLGIVIRNMRMFADVTKDPESGKDRLDGTLSFEGLTLIQGSRETNFEGDSTAMQAIWVGTERAPQGYPEVCGDLCGIVVPQKCAPPANFPPQGLCEDLAPEPEPEGPALGTLAVAERPLEPGDARCPQGGREVQVGYAGADGALDPQRVLNSFAVCNGEQGAPGQAATCSQRAGLAVESVQLEGAPAFLVQGQSYAVDVQVSGGLVDEDADALRVVFAGLGASFGQAQRLGAGHYQVPMTPEILGGPLQFAVLVEDGCTVASHTFAVAEVK